MKKSIVIILILSLNVLSAFAEQQKYVVVNQEEADKVIELLMKNQRGVDDKDKAWATLLIKDAFKKYFESKTTKAQVYEKSDIDEIKETCENSKSELNQAIENLNDSIVKINRRLQSLNDTINDRDEEISTLKKQYAKENFERRLEQIKSDCEKEKKELTKQHNIEMKARKDTISLLQERVNVLRVDSLDKNEQMSELRNNAKIAKNVITRYNEKKSQIDQLYGSYQNSEIKYVNNDTIIKSVSDYSEYVKMMGIDMPAEQKNKIKYLQSAARVVEIYRSAIELLDKKYDDKKIKEWQGKYKAIANDVNSLTNIQKTVMAQVENAVNTLGHATNHFKKIILPYLKEEGQIPDSETAKRVKRKVELEVWEYANGKFEDTTHYNPYHKNLNNVINYIYNNVNVMNEKDYNTFLSQIENSL